MESPALKAFLRALLTEDWLSVILAFLLILLAVIGVIGKTGLNITF